MRLSTLGGLLLVDLGGEAPEPAEHIGDLLAHLARYRNPRRCAAAARSTTSSRRTGRGSSENYNECLHCPGVHPELNALSNYMCGEEISGDGAWCGGSMTLTGDGAATMGSERRTRDQPPPIDGL